MARKASASVRSLLGAEVVRELALPSNLRYGTAIYRRGGVEFIRVASAEVTAWVGGLKGSVAEGGGQRRRTRLFVRRGALAWTCAGNPKNRQVFCKHCVALALAILKRRTRARLCRRKGAAAAMRITPGSHPRPSPPITLTNDHLNRIMSQMACCGRMDGGSDEQ